MIAFCSAYLISAATQTGANKVRLCPFAIPPSKHPNQARTLVHPPPELGPAFGGETAHWAGYRGGISAPSLDAYNASDLGDVVWPQFPIMYTIENTLEILQNRTWLYLSDISNYVPGDTDDCSTVEGVCEYHAPRATIGLLESKLGDRFTGMDNGEQDGRYMNYAPQHLRGRGSFSCAGTSHGPACPSVAGYNDHMHTAARGSARREAFLNFRSVWSAGSRAQYNTRSSCRRI